MGCTALRPWRRAPSARRGAGVSARHLGRLFRAETGMTPGQYVESVRLEAAQALLAGGSDPVDSVAEGAGFGSAETVRRTFQQVLGVSPTVCRARFRTTAVSGRGART
ncbi:helix-turn-helix domain-containing protein [Streptomyces sp. NPDC005794]|uniref:helix-turn-helix domain-containing protein n=1 Tax=Streptomyces sp. NPDC005794 TaxID=3364733 RepID=UPI0036D19677